MPAPPPHRLSSPPPPHCGRGPEDRPLLLPTSLKDRQLGQGEAPGTKVLRLNDAQLRLETEYISASTSATARAGTSPARQRLLRELFRGSGRRCRSGLPG